ncbi:MAG: glycoside hydrolase family 15 protein [Pseudonocardia sp.]
MPIRGETADVVRVVEGMSGLVPMRMALRLRFDYGHVVPWVAAPETSSPRSPGRTPCASARPCRRTVTAWRLSRSSPSRPVRRLAWLGGYEGAQPVRVGNAAAGQFQLDVWGEVLDGLHVARQDGLEGLDAAWDLQLALLDFLEGHWRDDDDSLWEMRGQRRPFVHSKVMAWAGIDRGISAVERFGLPGPVDRWRELRARIHDEVRRHGFDAGRETFTQFYGSKGLDAALLLLPRTGFLAWDDPRVVGTVDAVVRELVRDGLVMRYDGAAHEVDGLPGGEGASWRARSGWWRR